MARNIEGWKSITLFPYLIWYQCRSEQILKTLGENSKIPNRTENRICQSNNVEGKKKYCKHLNLATAKSYIRYSLEYCLLVGFTLDLVRESII